MEDQVTPGRVVIVGGGFGGLFAARMLRGSLHQVTVIDRATEHLFQPLLYQCATGILSEGQITVPLRKLFAAYSNIDCLAAEAVDVDAAGRKLICRRPLGEQIEIPYDHLIVAVGMQQSYFGHDEYAAWAPGMKTINDALTIRRRVFGAFEMAETSSDPDDQRHWLTFALVGAGPTGVELAGQIRELATKTLRAEYRKVAPEDARVLLFDGGEEPLSSFGSKLSSTAVDELESLGVELHMGTIVTNVDGSGVDVRDHEGKVTHHDAGTVLWTAGVEAPPLSAALARATGAERDKAGRIRVQADLTIHGHPEISVIGDLMALRNLPGLAEVAMQSGIYAGHRVRRLLQGGDEPQPFRYLSLGSAAYISRGRAIVKAGPVQLSGFAGWVVWLFIHIAFLTGYRNRVGAIVTWLLAFSRDTRRERTYTTRAIGVVSDVYDPLGVPAQAGAGRGAQAAAGQQSQPRPPAPRTSPPRPALYHPGG